MALDYADRSAALAFADRIDPQDCRLKVGKEMFTLFGPEIVRDICISVDLRCSLI
ncbi:Orotidine 5'-phosphate decarboxylase [Serratia fonticola]|uniref:Orotidine 5'-phosphate decarboxylase n=1 Tax=Serratia fonticola TaxID=47917 RepID=A0A4U9WK58_SERFO|nr:Orotidine 5'-phosphate decarboxylase [Serratia fonticola]